MRLDFNAFKMIMPSNNKSEQYESGDKSYPEVKPAKTTIQIIVKAMDNAKKSLNIADICDLTGLSSPTCYRTINGMLKSKIVKKEPAVKGLVRQAARFTLFDVDFEEVFKPVNPKERSRQKNNKSGITGVHFNKSTGRWLATYGRGSSYPFDNLFDAACKRRSLEAS